MNAESDISYLALSLATLPVLLLYSLFEPVELWFGIITGFYWFGAFLLWLARGFSYSQTTTGLEDFLGIVSGIIFAIAFISSKFDGISSTSDCVEVGRYGELHCY